MTIEPNEIHYGMKPNLLLPVLLWLGYCTISISRIDYLKYLVCSCFPGIWQCRLGDGNLFSPEKDFQKSFTAKSSNRFFKSFSTKISLPQKQIKNAPHPNIITINKLTQINQYKTSS